MIRSWIGRHVNVLLLRNDNINPTIKAYTHFAFAVTAGIAVLCVSAPWPGDGLAELMAGLPVCFGSWR